MKDEAKKNGQSIGGEVTVEKLSIVLWWRGNSEGLKEKSRAYITKGGRDFF